MSKTDRSPAMQFYFRLFSGDEKVMTMDLDSVGAHILLMCMAGASEYGYRLAYDQRAIRNVLRNPSEADFERIMRQLLAGAWKVSEDGKWIVQDGMKRILAKQKAFSKKQAENSKTRWANAKQDAKPMPNGIPNTSSLSLSLSLGSTPKGVDTPISPLGGFIPNESQPKKPTTKPKQKDPEIQYPENWTEAHRETFKRWMTYRVQIKKPLKHMSYQAQVNKFSSSPDEVAKFIERSITQGWQGLNDHIPFEHRNGFEKAETSRVQKNMEFAKNYLKELEDEQKDSH